MSCHCCSTNKHCCRRRRCFMYVNPPVLLGPKFHIFSFKLHLCEHLWFCVVCSKVAEFYEEMTKVESLNPLRTLHNAVPLKEMDSFFNKATGQSIEAVVTPVNTPSRKAPSKKLSGRSTRPTQLLEKMSNTTTDDIEGVTDLLTEAIQKLDS